MKKSEKVKFHKWFLCLIGIFFLSVSSTMTAYADSVSDAGGTGQGNISGTNVYTFSYIYDSSIDAIVLKVETTKPVKAFGNTCTHTFGPGDTTTLNTNYPQLGSSLESAIAEGILNEPTYVTGIYEYETLTGYLERRIEEQRANCKTEKIQMAERELREFWLCSG